MKKLMILTVVFVAASVHAGWGNFGKAAAKEATSATIRGVVGGLPKDKKNAGASSQKESVKPERNAKKMAEAKKGKKDVAGAVSDTSPSAVSLEDIAKIEDDAQLFAAFKDATKSNDEVSLSRAGVFERACRMKDENLLIEFLAMYPEWNARAADIHSDWSHPELHVKSSKLAEHMLDNCNRAYKGYHANLCGVLFFATRVLDATVREKYHYHPTRV